MDIENIYKTLAESKNDYFLTLCIEDFYTSILKFDPVTNESLYDNYDQILQKVSNYSIKDDNWFNDRFQNIVKYCETAIYQIMEFLHEKNLREHRITNPNKVRDVDTTCMMWLSKKPGFNIRQKIASEQKMMGVFHETSIDTSENRLFKAFLIKLDNIFLEKERVMKIFPPNISKKNLADVERLISSIHRWKYSEDADLISAWNNVPPNNTLLNDKNYRKIWKAWNFLQYLESDIKSDIENSKLLISEIAFIYIASLLTQDNRFQLCQDVIFPNYQVTNENRLSLFKNGNSYTLGFFIDKGSVRKVSLRLNKTNIQLQIENSLHTLDISNIFISTISEIKKISEDFIKKCIENFDFTEKVTTDVLTTEDATKNKKSFVAIDINKILPQYVYKDSKKIYTSNRKLLCQTITTDEYYYDIPCAGSKYITTKKDGYKTYSINHFFNPRLQSLLLDDDNLADIDSVSSYFAKTLSEEVNAESCVYLIPDNMDDFSPITNSLKRAMASQFSKALLLPKSVAAIFSNYKTILSKFHENDEFRIEDLYDSYKICIDYKVLYNDDLNKICPESKGFIFQRKNVTKINLKSWITCVPHELGDIFTNNDVVQINNQFSVDDFHFDIKSNIRNAVTVNGLYLNNSRISDYLSGVLFLYELQKKVDDNNYTEEEISLWKDYLPPLYFVEDDKSNFTLVGEDVSINPFSKKEEIIPISTHFKLPKNKNYFEFPLIQGEGKETTRYFAYIKDTVLPLKADVICKLKLTYTYGAPRPYNLEFIPIEAASFNSLTVRWENKSHRDLLHLPAPAYPEKITWEGFKTFEGSKGKINFIDDWIPKDIRLIQDKGRIYTIRNLKVNENGSFNMIFLKSNIYPEQPAAYVSKDLPVMIGQSVWCYVNPDKKYTGKYRGEFPYIIDIEGHQVFKFSKLRMAFKAIWNDSKSIYDSDCPFYFRSMIQSFSEYLIRELIKDIPSRIKNEYWLLLSCMAKDLPNEVCEIYVKNAVSSNENISRAYRNIGYMLDDVSKDWQRKTLDEVLFWLDDEKKYRKAIVTLSRAAWRNEHFIFQVPKPAILSLLDGISTIIDNFIYRPNPNSEEVSASLELFLSILRLRENDDEDLCRILSPYTNTNMKALQEKLKKMEHIFKSSEISLISFLKFDIISENKGTIPDLLYVAESYIDGKVDSNSIKILNNSYDEGD